jgi:hypothetical protein
MTLPSHDSLNYLVTHSTDSSPELQTKARRLQEKLSGTAKAGDKRYTAAAENKELNGYVLDLIFADSAKPKRDAVLGPIDRPAFEAKFATAGDILDDNLTELRNIFEQKSFPESYFEPLIAQELARTGKLTDSATMKDRITLTSLVMITALKSPECGFSYMLAIAESHKHRQPSVYNEDTVEYVLLTFSYFGHKGRQAVGDDLWFYLWKVFGSMMGLPLDRLHNNYQHAEGRMHQLRGQWRMPQLRGQELMKVLTDQQKQLLETFIKEKKLDTEHKIRTRNGAGLISSRMELYLREKKLWPDKLERTKHQHF